MKKIFYAVTTLIVLLFAYGCIGGGTIESYKPKITVTEPAGGDDTGDTTYIITWTDHDPDSDASISFYYDTDNTGADGTLIVSNLSEDSTTDYYVWDTLLIPKDSYYIYAVIDDGINDPKVSYSPGIVEISHDPGDNVSPSITLTGPDGTDDMAVTSYTIEWTDADSDDDAAISLYYDTDNSGYDGVLIASGISEDSMSDSWAWDVSALLQGEYYVYAVIDDGKNSPVSVYSTGVLHVWDGLLDPGSSDQRVNKNTAGLSTSDEQQIACSADRVYIVWTDHRNSNPDIYFNYSADGGVNFGTVDKRINQNTAGSSGSRNPQICASGNNVYILWEDRRNGSYYDVYFNCSADGGITWQGSDIRLNSSTAGGSESNNPRICCSGSNVYAVWEDYRNSRWEIYANFSTDGGATWQSSDLRLDTSDTDDSRNPKISCFAANVFVTWDDLRNGTYTDIYFNFIK